MRYRADIDGLRTIAVVPVVLFHAGMPFATGGFVGVDVFFVISGYLITNLIIADLDKGRFSIGHFYQRRIRRIFPALAVVIAFCLGAGFLLQTPEDYRNLGKSIAAAALFASNIYFWRSTSYFAANSDSEPLLHTWSLAVEEQYYIFYPLLLVLILSRLHWRKTHLLVGIAVASLLAASILVYYKQSAVFYLLPTRAWELMIGGIVAVAGGAEPWRSRITTLSAAALGLIAILVPMTLYTSQTLFPGLTALPPTVGAAVLIWTGAGQQTVIHRLLSSRPFVLIGKASYSFYLWHFPLLAFAKYAAGEKLSLPLAAMISLVALFVSFLSLALVERPFRRHGGAVTFRSAVVAMPLAAMVAVGASGLLIARLGGIPSRLDRVSRGYVDVEGDKLRHPIQCMSVDQTIVPVDRPCRLGAAGVTPSALLWGDSHAMVTATAMAVAATRNHAAFWFDADADCPIGLGFAISTAFDTELTSAPSYRYCERYNREMFAKAVGDPQIKSVVLSSRWTNWRIGEPANPAETPVDIRLQDARGSAASPQANEGIFERGFIELVTRLVAGGKQVFVVGPLPEPPFNVPHQLYIERLGLARNRSALTLTDFRRRHARILGIFERAAKAAPLHFIWPHMALCRAGVCPIAEGGEPLYFDHDHLSIYGARKTAPLYDVVFAGFRVDAAPRAQRVIGRSK